MVKGQEDVFSSFDPLLEDADIESSPWVNGTYVPNLDLLRELLTIPLGAGEKQESGRPAKAFDSWIAHELRRAGFPKGAVWPRTRRPRVLPDDLAGLETAIDNLRATLDQHEAATGKSLEPAAVRRAIRGLDSKLPGKSEAYILGDFYAKQIDVALTSWRRGPEVLISTKTMFSSYRKNLKNRHEEAVGEPAFGHDIRRRSWATPTSSARTSSTRRGRTRSFSTSSRGLSGLAQCSMQRCCWSSIGSRQHRRHSTR